MSHVHQFQHIEARIAQDDHCHEPVHRVQSTKYRTDERHDPSGIERPRWLILARIGSVQLFCFTPERQAYNAEDEAYKEASKNDGADSQYQYSRGIW